MRFVFITLHKIQKHTLETSSKFQYCVSSVCVKPQKQRTVQWWVLQITHSQKESLVAEQVIWHSSPFYITITRNVLLANISLHTSSSSPKFGSVICLSRYKKSGCIKSRSSSKDFTYPPDIQFVYLTVNCFMLSSKKTDQRHQYIS